MQLILIFYDFIFLPLALLALFFLSFFNKKIRRGLRGRIGNFRQLRQKLAKCSKADKKFLFHVSSFGEFLQAKPLMIQLKLLDPETCILVSVFSPSGFDNIKEEFPVDVLTYFPIDGFLVQRKFIKQISPSVAVIVRHDIWPNFLFRLKKQKIPTFLIDGTLPQKSIRYFPLIKFFFRLVFNQFSKILVVSEKEKDKFQRILGSSEKIDVIGDTKYDQVIERSKLSERIQKLAANKIFRDKQIFVAGSTWPEDENVLIPAFAEVKGKIKNLFMIIAPHEPHEDRIEKIRELCSKARLKCALLSQLENGDEDVSVECLIVDKIGILANIYSLSKVAFVGGSFFSKVHNVLEPAVYGIPVITGPKIKNSAEAIALVECGGAQITRSHDEFKNVLEELFSNPVKAKQIGTLAKQQVFRHEGSSRKIADYLINVLKNR